MARALKEPKEAKEEGAKRHWLSARTTAELNQILKDAAQTSGRSVSQEIEFRLEKSFLAEKVEAETKAKTPMRPLDQKSEALFRSISMAAGTVMTKLDASWVDDIYARAAVKSAIIEAFSSYVANNRIDLAKDGLDLERLSHATRIGQAFGRLMGDLSATPGGDLLLNELRGILSPSNVGLGDVLAPEKARRDIALKELNASLEA
ncbi:TraY domain-containing protein [Methylobacterium sp. P1-11]|uniref:TraY domain-containing protein n=1 Tax=Methylobacterium sp. P1-11 TaxID=2024616 RepID=UPI0011EE2E0A|nr:TraY domain-containing protein [Methylobacterium sp. P1-11]KAA0121394.1 TraY domain-containing protein [Methylobacterium sp. P1-11]